LRKKFNRKKIFDARWHLSDYACSGQKNLTPGRRAAKAAGNFGKGFFNLKGSDILCAVPFLENYKKN
jgi:hypothetical protein